jgi:hypothetical protein
MPVADFEWRIASLPSRRMVEAAERTFSAIKPTGSTHACCSGPAAKTPHVRQVCLRAVSLAALFE